MKHNSVLLVTKNCTLPTCHISDYFPGPPWSRAELCRGAAAEARQALLAPLRLPPGFRVPDPLPGAHPGAHTGPHARGALGPTFLRANTAPRAQLSHHKPGLILRAQWDRRHFGKQHRYLHDAGFIPGQLYRSTHGVSQHFKSLYMIGKDQSYDSMRSPLLWVKVKSPSRAECKQWTGSFLLFWWFWAPLPLRRTPGQHHPPALHGRWRPACSQTAHSGHRGRHPPERAACPRLSDGAPLRGSESQNWWSLVFSSNSIQRSSQPHIRMVLSRLTCILRSH